MYLATSLSLLSAWPYNIFCECLSIYAISCRKLSLTRLSESRFSYNVELAPLTADNVLTFEHQTSTFDGGDYDAAGSSFAYEVGAKENLALIEILTSPLYGLGFGGLSHKCHVVLLHDKLYVRLYSTV